MQGREKVSIRTVYYWLASMKVPFPAGYKGGKRADGSIMPNFENNETCLGLCNLSIKYARYLGLISNNDIVDEKTSEPLNYTGYVDGNVSVDAHSQVVTSEFVELDALELPSLPSYDVGKYDVPQAYHVELWCEKSTMNHILEPIARRHQSVYQDLSGESSATRVREAAERMVSDGRPARIGYISDYDPAGENMVRAMAVKLQHALIDLGSDIDVRVYRVALTQQQVEDYSLELIDLKTSEKRAKTFAVKHGQLGKPQGTELDSIEATNKGLLGLIVTNWLAHFYDDRLSREVIDGREAYEEILEEASDNALEPMRKRVSDFQNRYNETLKLVIAAMKPLIEERDQLWEEAVQMLFDNENLLPDAEVPVPEYSEDEPSVPLYNSKRNRLEQNLYWQFHKQNIPLEEVEQQIMNAQDELGA
jgi:hypothetical protein